MIGWITRPQYILVKCSNYQKFKMAIKIIIMLASLRWHTCTYAYLLYLITNMGGGGMLFVFTHILNDVKQTKTVCWCIQNGIRLINLKDIIYNILVISENICRSYIFVFIYGKPKQVLKDNSSVHVPSDSVKLTCQSRLIYFNSVNYHRKSKQVDNTHTLKHKKKHHFLFIWAV